MVFIILVVKYFPTSLKKKLGVQILLLVTNS